MYRTLEVMAKVESGFLGGSLQKLYVMHSIVIGQCGPRIGYRSLSSTSASIVYPILFLSRGAAFFLVRYGRSRANELVYLLSEQKIMALRFKLFLRVQHNTMYDQNFRASSLIPKSASLRN